MKQGFMISESEFQEAQSIIHQYWEERQRQADYELEQDDMDYLEPCPTCGEVDGMVNPCCPNYDPLHYLNCGYG